VTRSPNSLASTEYAPGPRKKSAADVKILMTWTTSTRTGVNRWRNGQALSLVAPEKILFRYKLEGRDTDWQEAGNRRQVFYNDLSPGNYRFRVMACNNSGLWNETGAYVDFTIAPTYYQTAWFRISVAVLFLLVLFALYQLRLRQVARVVRGRMEERLEERERIAGAWKNGLRKESASPEICTTLFCRACRD
jgi:hypothetical protein